MKPNLIFLRLNLLERLISNSNQIMMSKKRSKPALVPSIRNQQPTEPISSKYTYDHVSSFHKTIFSILGSKFLVKANPSDFRNVAAFVQLILRLMELSHISYVHEEQSAQGQPKSKHLTVKVAGIGAMRHSKICLTELLKWIDYLMLKDNLTLETILDEFYAHFPFSQNIPFSNPDLPPINDHTRNRYLN